MGRRKEGLYLRLRGKESLIALTSPMCTKIVNEDIIQLKKVHSTIIKIYKIIIYFLYLYVFLS